MTPTTNQIKEALRILAQRKGRPDYELCTVKEVKRALESGTEHHLIAELPFFEVLPREEDKPLRPCGTRAYPEPRQRKEVEDWLKSYKGNLEKFAILAGCSAGNLFHIRVGRINCTLDMYNKIMKARKELEVAA